MHYGFNSVGVALGGTGCLPAILAVMFMLLFLGGIATLAALMVLEIL